MLGFEPIVDGGWAWVAFSAMIIGIVVTLWLTISR